MSLSNQITLFEPAGVELAALCAEATKASSGFERLADLFDTRGLRAASVSMRRNAAERAAFAESCDNALSFERHAGLVA